MTRQSLVHRYRYALSVIVAVAAVAVGDVVAWATSIRAPFLTLFPATVFAGLLLGRGPGLLTLGICTLMAQVLWLEPRWDLRVTRPNELIVLAFFIVVNLLILWVCGRARELAQVAGRAAESEHQKLAVLESMDEGFVSLDRNLQVLYVNPIALHHLNRGSAELQGRTPWEVFPNLRGSAFEQTCRRALAEQCTLAVESPGFDSPDRCLEIRASGTRDGVAVFLRDVTERRQAERRLEHSAGQLRLITDSLPVLIAYVDSQERYQFANATYNVWFGKLPQDVVGKTIREFVGDATYERVRPYVRQALDGEVVRFESITQAGGTAAREVAVTYIPHFDGGGAVLGFMAMVEDLSAERASARKIERLNGELRRQVSEYDTLLELVPVGIGIAYDTECRQIRANPALATSLGMRPDQNVSKTPAGSDPPVPFRVFDSRGNEVPSDQLPMQVAAREGVEMRGEEFDIVHPDGRVVRLLEYVSPLLDEQQRPRGAVGVFVDVTERRRAEEAVRQSEARFRTMADYAPVLVWMADTTKASTWFNKPWLDFVGRTMEQDLGKGWVENIHADDAERSWEIYSRSFDARESFTIEYRLRRHDGQYRWIYDNGTPLFNAGGEFTGYIGSCVDVTDQKRIADALRVLADTGRELAASLDVKSTLRNAARLIVPRLADLCMADVLTPGGAIERVCVLHADPERAALAEALHRRYPVDRGGEDDVAVAIRSGEPQVLFDVTDQHLFRIAQDSEHLRILRGLHLRSCLVLPLTIRGRAAGALTLALSESGRRYTQDDLLLAEEVIRRVATAMETAEAFEAERIARNEAERTNRLKDEFLATLSHELRTPLNAILGWSQLLEQRPNDAAMLSEGLPAISRNARAQTRLIEDLLDMSRIISGKLQLEISPTQLKDVVTAAIQSVLPAAQAKRITIESDLEARLPAIPADSSRLQQAVWNLLTNAVKFTPAGGHICVTLRREASNVKIVVSDTGQGMSADFMPFLFTRFRQADSSTTRRHGGLGIGLALVKQLAELHGGSVTASSPGQGQGSTFIIELPLSQALLDDFGAQLAAERNASPRSDPMPLSGLTILMVEDEADTRLIARKILEEAGATVVPADSVGAAMECLQLRLPDVILSDIGMPEHDGYEFIRRVRLLPPEAGGNVPAVAVTAFARPADNEQAMLSGYQGYQSKPVNWEELIALIQKLTAGKTEV